MLYSSHVLFSHRCSFQFVLGGVLGCIKAYFCFVLYPTESSQDFGPFNNNFENYSTLLCLNWPNSHSCNPLEILADHMETLLSC